MPHLISDRPRLLALRASEKDPSVHDRWENTQALIYIIGGISFIVGSLLFVLGSSINILQVPAKSKRGNLQMINLTAVTFVAGSILFTVASVLYLWHFTGEGDRRILNAFLAAQYLVGSILFAVGGVTNAFRSLSNQRERQS